MHLFEFDSYEFDVFIADQTNFANGVTNPLSSLTNGSDPSVDATSANFGFENSFFPFTNNQSNVTNQTSGFLSGLISDEDLQLMGIAMNDSQFLSALRNYESSNSVSFN